MCSDRISLLTDEIHWCEDLARHPSLAFGARLTRWGRNRSEVMAALTVSALQEHVHSLRKSIDDHVLVKKLPRSNSVDLDDHTVHAHQQFQNAINGLKDPDVKKRIGECIPQIKLRKKLEGHYGKVYALHWAGDSKRLVSASQDGTLIIWNGMTRLATHMINLSSPWVMTCAFDHSKPDSDLVACGGLNNICSVYSVDDHYTPGEASEPRIELQGHEGYISCCRFTDNGTKMFTASGDQSCGLWDMAGGKREGTLVSKFHGHTSDVMFLSVNPRSSTLFVTGSCDMRARVWDIRTPSHSTHEYWGHDADINCVEFFDDGQTFATGSDDGTVRLWDLRSARELARLSEGSSASAGITSLAISKSGGLLFAGQGDYNCSVWNTLEPNKSQTPHVLIAGNKRHTHESRLSAVGVAPNGSAVCTGSWDNSLKIWA